MRKRGFTLIELLAVIVILAIISLIAMPLVLNTIDKAKEGAAKSSTYSYVSATETRLATYMLKNNGISYATGKHDVSELKSDLKVEVKGDAPSEGKVCIGEKGTIEKASLKINGYVINYDGKDATATDLEEVEDITCGESATIVPTYYYAFGTPTTSSTTDYTTIGKRVFARLGTDNTTGVCINDGGLFCINTNDYDNSLAAIKEHFGESNCTDDGSKVRCGSGTFNCYVYSNGMVANDNKSDRKFCHAYADGSFYCYWW